MKNLLLIIALVTFTFSSYANKIIVKTTTNVEFCEDGKKCDKKDCKHKTAKKDCKKGDKKACCSKDAAANTATASAKKSCCAGKTGAKCSKSSTTAKTVDNKKETEEKN